MLLTQSHPHEPLARFHARIWVRVPSGTQSERPSDAAPVRRKSRTQRANSVRSEGRLLCPVLFALQWMLIGCVSAFDAYLVAKYRLEIMILERNPMGQFLLQLDEGEPALFIGLKFLGTVCVLGIVGGVYAYSRVLGHCVAGALSVFQLGLLSYLLLA